ncbi:MAG: SDR family oxidoreductase [Pseudomonadota bacterium]
MTDASSASASPSSAPRRRLALVTGASAGIGAAFARKLAARGYDLALTARRRDRMEELSASLEKAYGAKSVVVEADLADPAAPDAIFEAATADGRAIDALVNNAGYGQPGFFQDAPWETHRDFLNVMVTAYAHLAHLVLPGMLARRFGRIINVASLAGLAPGSQGATLYGASKAFLISFTQSLSAETKGTGVRASAVCPGFTRSEFHDVTGSREVVDALPQALWSSAAEVAEQALDAADRDQTVFIPGAVNKAIAGLVRLTPTGLAEELARRQSKRYRYMGPRSAQPSKGSDTGG